ncbi:MAG TPA: TlpA disulfide reductase family protein [Chitinophagaceae bacterium]|nr:TlpA disulfide reductase family protein [Chitinophagaceae bacterium]
MKTIVSLLLFVPMLALAQAGTRKASFTVSGRVAGLADGSLVRLINANDNNELSQAKVAKGTFMLTGSVPEPGLYTLVLGKEKPQPLFLENSRIQVSGEVHKLEDLKVTGSRSHQDFQVFKKAFNPLFARMNAVATEINNTQPGTRYDSLMKQYESINATIQADIDQFVTQHPASYVSPFLLFVTAQVQDDPIQLEKRFNQLADTIRKSQIGSSLAQYIAYNKVGAVGTEALDFSQPDTTGKPVSLSSFRGKYVLVDFWASWCGPCRNENPNVVEAYHKFAAKNFTVLGVSLDRPGGRDNWLDAIHKDGLTWTHVSDLKFWNNEAAVLYHVQAIPFNILVDPNGRIIGRNLRGADLESKLCELLGCN